MGKVTVHERIKRNNGKRVIKARIDPYSILQDALHSAIYRGMIRHDKYSRIPLSDDSRATLEREIAGSFWLFLEESHVKFE